MQWQRQENAAEATWEEGNVAYNGIVPVASLLLDLACYWKKSSNDDFITIKQVLKRMNQAWVNIGQGRQGAQGRCNGRQLLQWPKYWILIILSFYSWCVFSQQQATKILHKPYVSCWKHTKFQSWLKMDHIYFGCYLKSLWEKSFKICKDINELESHYS